MKSPIGNLLPLMVKTIPEKSGLPTTAAMIGVRRSFTNAVTTAPKAPPFRSEIPNWKLAAINGEDNPGEVRLAHHGRDDRREEILHQRRHYRSKSAAHHHRHRQVDYVAPHHRSDEHRVGKEC